jgi:hypothetical protein
VNELVLILGQLLAALPTRDEVLPNPALQSFTEDLRDLAEKWEPILALEVEVS